MLIQPGDVSMRQFYDAMVAVITPRPIAWVSTRRRSSEGQVHDNLAPYSFFNGVGANPPTLMFCPAFKADGTPKDTHANIITSGEFVVNIVTDAFFDAMKQSADGVAADEDEFDMTDLAKVDSHCVDVPRVADVAAAIECRLHTALQLGAGPGGANLIVGHIVAIHVDEAVLGDEGQVDPEKVLTIGRMGGPRYTDTQNRFE
ncbi:MAG: flavin reductase family protein [Planctomycetota bacterium]